MSHADPATPNPAAQILAGLVERKGLADTMGRSERTIIRWERLGMPFIKLGMMRLYDPAKVREWLLGLEQRPTAPKRGRPAKRAA